MIRFFLFFQRLIVPLPWSLQRRFGAGLGRLVRYLLTQRRQVAARNIELAFPELTPSARRRLLGEHFGELGRGLLALGLAWHASEQRLAGLGELRGADRVRDALAAGRGVLLVVGHFTTLDMTNRLLGRELTFTGLWRPLGLPVLDAATLKGRRRATASMIAKTDLKAALATLRGGGVLAMAVDQAAIGAGAVEAPFFGIDALTTTTPSRLAQRCGCPVLPVYTELGADGRFVTTIEPALEGFPGGDTIADAARINAVIEAHARRAPAQYYWVHRRFKSSAIDHYAV